MLMYNSKNKFEIDGTTISSEDPCYIIAEIGINHNGDLSIAKNLIENIGGSISFTNTDNSGGNVEIIIKRGS